MKKREAMRLLILAACLTAAGCFYSCAPDWRTSEEALVLEESLEEGSQEYAEPLSQEAFQFYVHVCGEVRRPGVYQMKEGQRLYEAVEQAGGFTEMAAPDYLNLAEPVWDGMQVLVPSVQQIQEGWQTQGGSNTGKVNLNTATREELMRLRGIGEARAEAIIQYRQEKGRFSAIEEIMKVSGIKEAAFEKIKDDITV